MAGINLTEIQQKVDRLLFNIAEQNRRAYEVFFSPTPAEVELPQLDENGNLTTVKIPNRAKVLSDFEAWKTSARGEFPLPENLIANSFMTELTTLDDGTIIPTGYSYSGVKIEAVHPFTKGFEGPYTAEKPENAVDDPELATADTPYWYGGYYKGPRISRGGLAGGWCGIGNGHILKITAQADGNPKAIWFPSKKLANVTKIGFRAWLKIVKGSRVGLGTDSGVVNGAKGYIITKEEADSYPQGWMFIDIAVSTSNVVRPFCNNFTLGFDFNEEIEVYLALPYAYIPFGTKHMTE